jgi:prephenate dehydrogenase
VSAATTRRSAGRDRAATPRLLRGRSIGIVGLGLIGGSLLRGLSRHRPAVALRGHDRRPELSAATRRYGTWCQSIDDIVDGCDVVVLSVPAPEIVRLLPIIAARAAHRSSPRRLLVCDTGTVKAPVVRAAARWRAAFDFAGLHPLAGGERGGWEAADAGIFRARPFLACPSTRRAGALVRELIRLVGGVPFSMDARAHDRIVADTIGVPHALAFAAAGILPAGRHRTHVHGRSWQSLTRVAASDPAMVAGFLHANATNQIRALARMRKGLALAEQALRQPSHRQIQTLLARWQARAAAPRRLGKTAKVK